MGEESGQALQQKGTCLDKFSFLYPETPLAIYIYGSSGSNYSVSNVIPE